MLLIGQPELQQKLQLPQLRQLAQRITGRYHLLPLNQDETRDYIKFRLSLAGGDPELFSAQSIKYIARQTQGIPRLINLVCDATLREAYALAETKLSHPRVARCCDEVMSFQSASVVTSASQSHELIDIELPLSGATARWGAGCGRLFYYPKLSDNGDWPPLTAAISGG